MSENPFNSGAQQQDDAQSFLMGGGITGQKFPHVGFTVDLTWLSWKMAPQTDMDTGEIKTWADGRKRMQMVVTAQGEATGITWETNAYVETSIEDDDGVRALYIKGNLQKAIRDGIRNAGMKGPEVGMLTRITRGKSEKPKTKGQQGAHTYTVVVTPAAKNPKWAEIQADEAAADLDSAGDENPFGNA